MGDLDAEVDRKPRSSDASWTDGVAFPFGGGALFSTVRKAKALEGSLSVFPNDSSSDNR